MLNTRPLADAKTQEALDLIHTILRHYDLAGAVCVVNEQEMGFAYALYTTWNIVVEDPTVPMGFRLRLKTAEQGQERARALMLGTGAYAVPTPRFWHADADLDARFADAAETEWSAHQPSAVQRTEAPTDHDTSTTGAHAMTTTLKRAGIAGPCAQHLDTAYAEVHKLLLHHGDVALSIRLTTGGDAVVDAYLEQAWRQAEAGDAPACLTSLRAWYKAIQHALTAAVPRETITLGETR